MKKIVNIEVTLLATSAAKYLFHLPFSKTFMVGFKLWGFTIYLASNVKTNPEAAKLPTISPEMVPLTLAGQ